jgi:hypothetical protein
VAGVVGGVERRFREEQRTCGAAVVDVVTLSLGVSRLRAEWRYCASVGMREWARGRRTVAGVVGGVECGDGEEQCAHGAADPRAAFCGADTSLSCVSVQDGDTALLLACSNGNLEVAQWLVSSAGSSAVTERNNVRTHAAYVCYSGC